MEYKRIKIDLSVARENETIEFGGYYTSFMIVKNDAEFEYKINTHTSDTLYSEEVQGLNGAGVFSRIFVTNESTDGEAILVVYK